MNETWADKRFQVWKRTMIAIKDRRNRLQAEDAMKTSRTTKIILTMLIISLILPGIASSQKTDGNDDVNLPNPVQEFNPIEQIPKFIVTEQENRPTPAPGGETEQLKVPVALSGAPFELPIEPTPRRVVE